MDQFISVMSKGFDQIWPLHGSRDAVWNCHGRSYLSPGLLD